jgi:hypothetical protein
MKNSEGLIGMTGKTGKTVCGACLCLPAAGLRGAEGEDEGK